MPGKLQSQEFTASGTFNVPVGVTAVWLTLIAGGGAGGGTAPTSGGSTNASGAGGSGEICQRVMKIVPSGGTVTVTIGAGGTQGVSGLAPGNPGGDTSFGTFFVRGSSLDNLAASAGFRSSGGWDFSLGGGGAGGGAGGAASNTRGTSAYIGTNHLDGQMGIHGAPCWQGGGQGGCGDSAGSPAGHGGKGAPEGGYPPSAGGVAASGGGGGGASVIFGSGPVGVTSGFGTNATSTVYGSGGGGAGANGANALGGTGAPGYCLVQWIS